MACRIPADTILIWYETYSNTEHAHRMCFVYDHNFQVPIYITKNTTRIIMYRLRHDVTMDGIDQVVETNQEHHDALIGRNKPLWFHLNNTTYFIVPADALKYLRHTNRICESSYELKETGAFDQLSCNKAHRECYALFVITVLLFLALEIYGNTKK